jgi:hypothetical protein
VKWKIYRPEQILENYSKFAIFLIEIFLMEKNALNLFAKEFQPGMRFTVLKLKIVKMCLKLQSKKL